MLRRISEYEIKLAIDSSATAALYKSLSSQRTVGGLALVRSEDRRLRDAYFDTRELLLWQTGGYLRIRHEPGRFVHCLGSKSMVKID